MSRQAILEQFDWFNVWSRGDQRAPHKPLLVLYALGRWSRDERGDVPFRDAEPVLTSLLKEFGPSRQSYHAEYPFWRLQNDGLDKLFVAFYESETQKVLYRWGFAESAGRPLPSAAQPKENG